MQGSQVAVQLTQLMDEVEDAKDYRKKLAKIDADLEDCEDCGVRHTPGGHASTHPARDFYLCSPITSAAWGDVST